MGCGDKNIQHIYEYLKTCDGGAHTVPKKNSDQQMMGFTTRIISLAKQSSPSQFGSCPEDEAMVRQWIEYAACYANYMSTPSVVHQVMTELNGVLSSRTFFIGNRRTLSDAVMYTVLYDPIAKMSLKDKEKYLHVSRWFDFMQHDPKLRQKNSIVRPCL